MKKLILLLILAFFGGTVAFAQEDEKEESHSYSSLRAKVGGAGGVTPLVAMFKNDEINKALKASGIPTLSSDPMYLIGGMGYGYIMFLRNVRMGGFGVTGSRSVSMLDPTGVRKDIDYKITYGGFLVDYVHPLAQKLDISIGASIGGGSVDIVMRRDDNSFKDWNGIWSEEGTNAPTKNVTRTLQGSFTVFQPNVGIEYTLLTWLQLRVGVGYPIFFSPTWTLDDKYDLLNVPSKLKADGFVVNTGIMFGFFGW